MPDKLAAAAEPSKSPGRFLVVGLAGLCAVLMYLDRVCISILGAYVPEDLGLSPLEWAWALSSFFGAYALGQVPAGSLSDRFGPRRMLTIYVLLWSACTAVTGMATSFVALLTARLACGLSQAGAYPTSAVLVKRWIPLRQRGMASSIVSLGGRLGGAMAPALTALAVVGLTPADVATQITSRDVLKPKEIAKALVATDNKPSSELIAELRPHVTPFANGWPTRLSQVERPAPEDVDRLASFLDYALNAPWLSDKLSAKTLGLPNEAVAILKISRSDRSALQIAKLHRLALEAAFPGSLRQIYTPAWRRVLWLYGACGLVVAAAFWLFVRDWPPQGAAQDPAALRAAEPDGEKTAGPRQSPVEVFWLLATSRNLWFVSITQFGVNVGWAFLITLFPDYLVETFQVPLEERGRMVGIPTLIGCLGMLAGGVLTDRLARRLGLRLGRSLPIGLSLFVCAGVVTSCCWAPSAWAVVGALGVMAALVDLGVPSIWAFIQDIGGRHVGAALGWGNMCGNLGAFVSPVLLRRIEESYGWNAAFAACAVSFTLAGLCALCLDATRPLEAASPPDTAGS